MSETISIMFDENGIAKEYDDTFDITIHCESEEEQNKVLEILNRRWIPVSERLPEIHQDILLSLRSLDVEVGFRAETEPYFYCHGAYIEPQNVLAWMPLPERYKDGE